MKFLFLPIISLALAACGSDSSGSGENNEVPDNSTAFQLDISDANYLAYQIDNSDWVQAEENTSLRINSRQTIKVAYICTEGRKYGTAYILDSNSITDQFDGNFRPVCDSPESNRSISFTSKQTDIAIALPSVSGSGINTSSAVTISSRWTGNADMLIGGLRGDNKLFLAHKTDVAVSDGDTFEIDFYGDNTYEIETEETNVDNWDSYNRLYLNREKQLTFILSGPFIPQFLNTSFIVPDELANDDVTYQEFYSQSTNIENLIFSKTTISKTIQGNINAPENYQALNGFSVSRENSQYILKLPESINQLIDKPLQTLKVSNYYGFSTRLYTQADTTSLSITPVDFFTLPQSPLSEIDLSERADTDISLTFYHTPKDIESYVDSDNLSYLYTGSD